MQEIPEQSISAWAFDSRHIPSVVDWICPWCSQFVSFSATNWRKLSDTAFHAAAHCPRRQCKVQLFMVEVGTGGKSLAGGKLFMFPAGRVRVPLPEVLDNARLSDPLKRAYRASVEVANASNWNATVAMCRRLLEGVTKSVVPASVQGQPLAAQLKALPSHVDLAQPILELADAVRKGGNLGAHFDLDKEPDAHVATLTLELCEDLLQYLFVLPLRIADLHARVEALGSTNDADVDPSGS